MSLEAESYIPPLSIHRENTLLKYFHRVLELPDNTRIVSEIKDNFESLIAKPYSSVILKPLCVRANELIRQLGLEPPKFINVPLISPLSPMIDKANIFHSDFYDIPLSRLSDDMVRQNFLFMKENTYAQHLEIYTDGSVFSTPEQSCSSAFVIKSNINTTMQNFRLPKEYSILQCEFHAIESALEFIKTNNILSSPIVIYTDSKCSIQALKNPLSKCNLYYIYKIHQLIHFILRRTSIHLQFVPGHRDIEGNELADLAAKAGHNNQFMEGIVIPREAKVRYVQPVLLRKWERYWHQNVLISGKGRHMKNVKQRLVKWEWACNKNRTIETVFAKLRIGHVNTAEHLHRFNLAPSPFCACGNYDNVYHIFMQCPNYEGKRQILRNNFRTINVDFNVRSMLGGGPYDLATQYKIVGLVANFLNAIGRLNRL